MYRILYLLVFLLHFGYAQNKEKTKSIFSSLNTKPTDAGTAINNSSEPDKKAQVHLKQLFKLAEHYENFHPVFSTTNKTNQIDTMIIGIAPNDTIIITGNYTHNGPIWVVNNGVLIFQNANFTNIGGDLVVFGDGQVWADNSTLTFPQNYFYERSIILVQNAFCSINNCTLNYGGYQHNLVVNNNANLYMHNVTQPDWTTAGLWGNANIVLNGTNQAGEFILMDSASFDVKNSSSVLIWHHFPKLSNINWSFGTSDTAYGYLFNNTQSGVSGVAYEVKADSCYNMMWAMMPASQSDVTISNSKIRAIGLWFDNPNDSTQVSGLINNTTYTNFSAPLNDRNLQLNNSYNMTWSLYVFRNDIINVSSSIVGEIGTFNSSKMYGSSYVVDGTGGYHFSSDSSTCIVSNLTDYSSLRSEKNSFFIVVNSTVNGTVMAIGNSILVAVQTGMPNPPVAVENAVAWYNYINQPPVAYADSFVNINGWAFIDKTASGFWMDFSHSQLFYQTAGNTTWTQINAMNVNEVRNNLLGTWDTHGLPSGVYILKQTLTDTWGNTVDAFIQVNLLPGILGKQVVENSATISVYPVPATEQVYLSENCKSIQLLDDNGKLIKTVKNANSLNICDLVSGEYLLIIETKKGSYTKKIIKD